MAYALVSAGSVSSGTTSVTPAFGATTGAAHLLIACVYAAQSTPTTCSDGSWVKAAEAAFVPVSAVWYKPNSGSGETAPQFTGFSTGAISAVLAEFSGGATASPVDKTKTSGPTSSPSTATMASADVASGELLIASSVDGLSKAGTVTTSESFNNGATATDLGNNDATSTTDHYRFAYGFTTGNSSADANTHSDNSMNLSQMNLVLVSFKLASLAFIPQPPLVVPRNQAVNRASTY